VTSHPGRTGEFTGWHMAGLLLLFFGTIIAVNLTLAGLANRSWSGFVVRNSYIASQQFNRHAAEARAQRALGWSGSLSLRAGKLRYRLTEARGARVPTSKVTASLRRPVFDRQDRLVALSAAPDGSLEADLHLEDGLWILEVMAEAGLPYPYRDLRRIRIINGALQ
jgi:nitrogen fixation protein FixH